MWNNTEKDLIEGIKKHGVHVLEHALCSDDLNAYSTRLQQEYLDYPVPPESLDKNNWFVPKNYEEMNIESWLISECQTDKELERVNLELNEYKQRNFIPVLRQMKYIVDTLRENNIVWGVGRGSSVASYVLFLIGVHKIDSIKYDLPIEEFFKGETNG